MRKLISVLVLAGAVTALGDGLPDGYTQLEYFSLKATQGELHIDTTGVSGETEFAGLSLAGNMRLVKEGAGTIRLTKRDQTHVGGMEVLGGGVTAGSGSASINYAFFGERGSDVVVRGTNTGTNYIGCADSPSFVDLRGHTLSTYIEEGGRTLYLYNVTVDNGLVDVVSGGWFGSRGTIVATNNVSFRVNCACDIQGEFYAKNYTYLQESPNHNRGDGVVDVYGMFGIAPPVS